jgi:hypothetical protein
LSCKSPQKEEKQLTVAEKIANAHGFESWGNVSMINFTFNVDRDSSHFERSWQWGPKTNDIIMISKGDTVAYNRSRIDSTNLQADKRFINDKYWLLAPFNLIWDEGTTISERAKKIAPISKDTLNSITLSYSNQGGYTPGDAYDFYFGDDFLIKEWVYRQDSGNEPSTITTWENYQNFNGLKIALDHKKSGIDWNLNFTNINVILED